MEELLQKIREFNQERNWGKYHTPKNLAMSVLIEAGELAEIFQWMDGEESRNPDREEMKNAAEEIADVFIYLLNLSDKLGIDPVEASVNKLKINAVKYPVSRCRGSRLKYDTFKKDD